MQFHCHYHQMRNYCAASCTSWGNNIYCSVAYHLLTQHLRFDWRREQEGNESKINVDVRVSGWYMCVSSCLCSSPYVCWFSILFSFPRALRISQKVKNLNQLILIATENFNIRCIGKLCWWFWFLAIYTYVIGRMCIHLHCLILSFSHSHSLFLWLGVRRWLTCDRTTAPYRRLTFERYHFCPNAAVEQTFISFMTWMFFKRKCKMNLPHSKRVTHIAREMRSKLP